MINKDQEDALVTFAKANGRTWKSKLWQAWYSGNYEQFPGTENYPLLQQIRNNAGPDFLAEYKLQKEA